MIMLMLKLAKWFPISVETLTRNYATSNLGGKERVVITGLGIVCPLGAGVPYVWKRLLRGDVSASSLDGPEYQELPCKVAACIPKGDGETEINLLKTFKPSELKTFSTAAAYGLLAAQEALQDAKWFPEDPKERESTGVAVGTGMIDLLDVVQTGNTLSNKGYSKVSPYFIPRILGNMTAGHISMRYGFKGPNHCVSTACSTGTHAIGDAFNFITSGNASVMVCGGTEAVISPLSIAAFSRIRALSTRFNSRPLEASRPFDKERDGFVMGEGAGILILESLSHALQRNAKIYAEVVGYGLSGDAYHITSPSPDGHGAFLCMKRALEQNNLNLNDVCYINAHATSTPIGDAMELMAIQKLFGSHSKQLVVSSTKGATGHLLGAAGCIEAIFTILACQSGIIPPTANLQTVDPMTDIRIVTKCMEMQWNSKSYLVMSNSFGFGGTNASIAFKAYDVSLR